VESHTHAAHGVTMDRSAETTGEMPVVLPAGRPVVTEAAGGPRTATARRSRWVAPAVGAAVAGLTVARLLSAGPGLDRVWAEDGFVFLWDARRHGLASLVYSYAGYAHTLPRALGWVGAQLPLAYFAAYAVLSTAVIAGVLAAVVHTVARRVIGSSCWALLPALGVGLTPAFRGSVGSLANLQWLLLLAALWCLLDPVLPGRRRWLPCLVALVAAATTPLTALLLPVALLTHRRFVLRSPAVLGLLGGLAFQAAVITVGAHSADNPASRHVGFSASLSDALLTAVAGPNTAPWQLGRFGTLDHSTLLGVVFAGALLLSLQAARVRRTVAVAVAVTGLLLYAATSVLSGAPTTRYSACAAMFLVSALALVGPELPTLLRRVGLLALLVNIVLGFPASDFRLSGPSWHDEVADYEQSCASTGRGTPLQLSPAGWGVVDLRCPTAG